MRVRTGGGSPFVFWELTLLKLKDDDDDDDDDDDNDNDGKAAVPTEFTQIPNTIKSLSLSL